MTTFPFARAVIVWAAAAAALIAPGVWGLGAPVTLINCGSFKTRADSQGDVWQSDKLHAYYLGGGTAGISRVTKKSIQKTRDNFLYQSSREFKSAKRGPYRYEIPVPKKGKYTVVLHFSETNPKPGGRRMHIKLEGDRVYKNLDVMALAGGAFSAVKLRFDKVKVSDGALTVDLVALKSNPAISAIGIYEHVSVEPPPPPTESSGGSGGAIIAMINAGGPKYTDKFGRVWEADKRHLYYAFGGGTEGEPVKSAPFVKIAGTKDDALFKSHRVFRRQKPGPYNYEIAVPGKANYVVTLLFCETDSAKEAPNDRVFDVWMEGKLVYKNLDIVAKAGGAYTALELTSTVRVKDGSLSIEFTEVKFNPIISGILVMSTAADLVTKTSAPSAAPIVDEEFQPILVNCGGASYVDKDGNSWSADYDVPYSIGGSTASTSKAIAGTLDDSLYQSHRLGANFRYEVSVPPGEYELTIHLAETYSAETSRGFNILVEGSLIWSDVDVVGLVGSLTAMTLAVVAEVTDGWLSLRFEHPSSSGLAFVSALEIELSAPHLAHAVSRGPYAAVVVDASGFASVVVDGSFSHTHAPGKNIISWLWSEDGTVVGSGEVTTLNLPVGAHTILLLVKDEDNNKATETFSINIFPTGFAVLDKLTPNKSSNEGGYPVTLSGSGFGFTENLIVVTFGIHTLTGKKDLRVVDSNTIIVLSAPPTVLGAAVRVSVTTPLSTSNDELFTYVNGAPISFMDGLLFSLYGPTSLVFGPDEKLYIGTSDGTLVKLTLNDNLDTVVSSVSSSIASPGRLILGIAFDPMDTSPNPGVYVTHSKIFHGGWKSSSGGSINGKVSRVTGANLDFIDDVITGLPVSDHDHGVSGVEFGDHGEIYVSVGSSTNGGIPGPLSRSFLLKDNVLSAAVLVGRLSNPAFNGAITYSTEDDGDQVGAVGSVDVFAAGTRNAYSIVLHSNGHLYATDNGPNFGYGDMSTSCSKSAPGIKQDDKLLLIEENKYYGFPNRKRGEDDSTQCAWHSAYAASSKEIGYTAPMAIFESSTNGIIEWQSLHFGGQMRGDLITGQYKGKLFRVVLAPDGKSVVPESQPPIVLSDQGGLDLTQGPDGTLYVVKYKGGKIRYLKPLEVDSPLLAIKSVFPHRGGVAGGSVLNVYGDNFDSSGTPTVMVGGSNCVVLTFTASKITCILPGGSGTVDITVSSSGETFTLSNGYRFITGLPAR